MRLSTVGVIGAGTSGKGIIRALAGAGLQVVFTDLSQKKVDEAMEEIEENLNYEITRWGITSGEKRLILSRISGSPDARNLTSAQVVIEATSGDLQDRRKIFADLDALFPTEAVLLTNCSTICISEIVRNLDHPDRAAGMHFSLPVHERPVVEISRGRYTSERTMEVVRSLAKLMKKQPIEVLEMPGLVTTRIMIPYINEAMHIVMEGMVPPKQVDEAIRLGFHLPVGPLTMADRIGLDTLLKDMERLFNTLGMLQYRPCPILRRMVRMGHLGVKTRRGFFCYDEHENITSCPVDNFYNS